MVNLFGQGRPSGIEDVFRGLEQLVEALVAAAIIASVILESSSVRTHSCSKKTLKAVTVEQGTVDSTLQRIANMYSLIWQIDRGNR